MDEWGRAGVMARSKLAATTMLVFGSLAAAAGVLAQQAARPGPPAQSPGRVAGPGTAPRIPEPDYMVEPSDILRVQAREGLPGRPIAGERLVRPDGMITLGYYGMVYAAGLTPDEIKAKIITQLHKHLSDEQLGLVRRDADGTLHRIPPAESDRVSVVVSTSNSKSYFVQRAGASPRRFPLTGDETVLDALNRAGFTAGSSPSPGIRLVRLSSSGFGRSYSLPIDYEAILRGGDPATNHRLLPGDRIIVARDPGAEELGRTAPSAPDGDRATVGSDREGRLEEIERKLDRVLEALQGAKRDEGQ
jgi:polysaccharide export outer membrane protein